MEDFTMMIKQMMQPDSQVIHAASEAFDELKRDPDTWAQLLIGAIRTSPDVDVRAMCCVLLRGESFGTASDESPKDMWRRMSAQAREGCKTELMHAMLEEPVRTVAKKVCDTIGEMACFIHLSGEAWPELLPFLFNGSSHKNPDIRENSLFIFSRLAFYLIEPMRDYFTVLRETFATALADPESLKVRKEALAATSAFIMAIEDPTERLFFEPLTGQMLECISESLNANDEKTAQSALQLFIDLAEVSPRFLRKNLAMVINAMLTMATSGSLSDSTRHLALEFLTMLCERAPAMLRKFETFLDNVFPVCLNMMIELDEDPDWNQNHAEDDMTEVTNPDFAEQAIDRIACAVGGSVVLPIALNILPKMAEHSDWRYRHAMHMAISAIGEGCASKMEENMGHIVSLVFPAFEDPHPRVRYACCQAIGQLCIDFGPGFQNTFHPQVLPGLMGVMRDFENPRTQAHASAALLNFSNNVASEVLNNYLEALLTSLMAILNEGTTHAQEQALSAVAAIADTAKDNFAQYYQEFVPSLKNMLVNATGKEYRVLRGKALECFSMIGLSVGKETFLNDAHEIMKLIIDNNLNQLPPDDPQIPYMLAAWARIAQCITEDFLPYLEHVMPPLLAAAQLKPTFAVSDRDEQQQEEAGWQSIPLGDSRINIKTSALEDKAAASRMLVCLTRDLKGGIFPFVDDIAKTMVPLLSFYFHDDVRISAAEVCPFLVVATVDAIRQDGGNNQQKMGYLSELFPYVVANLLQTIHAEPDHEILTLQLDALHDTILAAGENCLNGQQLQELVQLLGVLLHDREKRAGERQEARRDEDYDGEEEAKLTEQVATDELVLREVANVVDALFKCHGNHFVPHFTTLSPMLRELLQPHRTVGERAWSMCMWDALVEYAPESAPEAFDQFAELMLHYAGGDEAPQVRQAALFGIGVAARNLGSAFEVMLEQALAAIDSSLSVPNPKEGENASATDNAIAALANIIEHQNVPNRDEQIAKLLSVLPVCEDEVEGQRVYSLICTLIEQNHPVVIGENGGNVPTLFALLASIYGTNFCNETLSVRIVNIIRQIHSSLPAEAFNSLASSLGETERAKLQSILS